MGVLTHVSSSAQCSAHSWFSIHGNGLVNELARASPIPASLRLRPKVSFAALRSLVTFLEQRLSLVPVILEVFVALVLFLLWG